MRIIARLCSWRIAGETGRQTNYHLKERKDLEKVCDQHLRELVEILEPSWLVGVGGFARKRAEEALGTMDIKIGTILHPSPASPAANRGWAEASTKQMLEQNIW